jgi:nucleoid-associated protein YgaU
MGRKKVYYKKEDYKKLIVNLLREKYVSLIIGLFVFYFFTSLIYQNFFLKNFKNLKMTLPKNFNLLKKPTPTPYLSKAKKEKKPKTYVVQEGDSLSSIAEKFYGDLYKWPKLMEANRLSNPDIIEVGMVLFIPD